jgi:hypothetical protein
VLFHPSTASAPLIWFHWFSSDALGTIAVAPLAIGLASLARDFPPRREIAEGALALAVVSVVCALLVLPAQRAVDRGDGDRRALPIAALDRISPSSSLHRSRNVPLRDHHCLDHNLRNRRFSGTRAYRSNSV